MSDTPQDPVALIRAYHARTRHHFNAYAEGPGQLDWDAQPAPFRHYSGAPRRELPLAADAWERPWRELSNPPATPAIPDITTIGALFELSFAISAWKSWGPNRWALRCNPSSGNLHPVEAWLLCGGLPELPDGLHHYDPENHALETRALVAADAGPPWLAIGLSSAMWREAWKYGERAFRYCQLDVGHALGALSYAAALLGWQIRPVVLSGKTLTRLLGLDRPEDFPSSRYAYTENEEAEMLLAVHAPGLQAPPTTEILLARWQHADWQGKPSRIDPAPGYRWPVIEQAAMASRQLEDARSGTPPIFPVFPPRLPQPCADGAARLIRQRRSGQRFDPRHSLPADDFYRLLDATLPRAEVPFSAQEASPRIHLLLFVLRVEGLSPGLYLLPRTPAAAADLPAALAEKFPGLTPVAASPLPGLLQLCAMPLQELQRLARALSCHQDIASSSAFSLAMLGELDTATAQAPGYRSLLREAGLLGQALYLEAEAAGVRGTGIGCFFDAPVGDCLGLSNSRWQSIYHFTIGRPITDERIETSPPYPQRAESPR